jgi:hypothetical protein
MNTATDAGSVVYANVAHHCIDPLTVRLEVTA